MTNTEVHFTKADRTEFNGWPSSKGGRDRIRSEINTSWDGGDPWGSGLMFLGGLQDVIAGRKDESYPSDMLRDLLVDEIVSTGDAQYWHQVLDRYLDGVPEEMRY